VPCTVYRPGVVVGDSKTGETGKFDGPYFVLRMMEKLPSPGLFFLAGLGSGTVNLVPVDFVIESLAALSACPGSLGKTYHLCDPQAHSPRELAEMFAAAIGKSFAFLPVPMAVAKAFFGPKPVQRFFGMPVEALDYFDNPVRHDTAQATKDLGELGIECPRLREYLPRLVSFYRAHRDDVRTGAMV
jgi:nucleoside-diphosphate-sugar epimerase